MTINSKKNYISYYFDILQYKHSELFNCEHVWKIIGSIGEYLKNYPLGCIKSNVPNGTYLIDPELIYIGKETIIEPGSYIKGPCIIGDNCQIRHGAYIRGNVIVGDCCVLGHDSEFKNSVLLNNSKASHFAYIGDSVIGNNVNIGAGTKCANLKLNNEYVYISSINTQLKKLGSIIGDNTQIGCNSVTNPGTFIGKNVICYPCTNIRGFIPSDSIVKMETSMNIVLRK